MLTVNIKLANHGMIRNKLSERDGKGRPFTVYTAYRNSSVHKIDKLFDNGKAKSRPFYMPVPAFVNPFERIEQIRQIFLPDTHSGVRYGNGKFNHIIIRIVTVNAKSDMSLLGVFYGIVKKVYYDLFDTDLISVKCGRNLRIHTHLKSETLILRPEPHHVDDLGEHISYPVINGYYVHAAGFDLRKIKDVIDERKEHLAGSLYAGCILYDIIGGILITQYEFVKPEYRVDRCTYFMTHT